MSRRRPKPARGVGFGILNPYGDLWTYDWFRTEADARRHVADFWRGNKSAPDLNSFKVIPVRVTVSALHDQSAGNASDAAPERTTGPGGDQKDRPHPQPDKSREGT